MLINSSHSQNQSSDGDVAMENADAIIQSNKLAAFCAFATAFMLFGLGLFRIFKK